MICSENWAIARRRKLIDNSALSLRHFGYILRSSVAASANLSAKIVIVASALRWVDGSIGDRVSGINSFNAYSGGTVSSKGSVDIGSYTCRYCGSI